MTEFLGLVIMVFSSVYDRATARTVEQEMMPYGLNGPIPLPRLRSQTKQRPQLRLCRQHGSTTAVLAEECGRLMAINRQLTKQLNNATHD
jgi:hypothetical protein